jgi:hypothetical protein
MISIGKPYTTKLGEKTIHTVKLYEENGKDLKEYYLNFDPNKGGFWIREKIAKEENLKQ